MINFKPTGNSVNGVPEFMFTDGSNAGVSWVYGAMNISEEENTDGSVNMSFDYEITNNHKVSESFETEIGEVLIHILEESVEHETKTDPNSDN